MINIRAWLIEFRYRFLLFVTLPVLIGSAIAYTYYPSQFSLTYFLLTVVAMLLLHAGTIIINDYYDYLSGTDVLNTARTPYSGGSGLLPDRVLKPAHVLAVGLACFGVCILVGLFIVVTRSPAILLIGVAGVCLGVAYTMPPFKLSYRGLGELARLIATPLIVVGAFIVQVPIMSIPAVNASLTAIVACLAVSLPVAFFNTAALYIFEFPDYAADLQVGKKNLVVRLGTKNAAYLFVLLQVMAYVSMLAAVFLGILPWTVAIIAILLPLSVYAILGLLKYNADAFKLLPYLKAASNIYIISSILLVIALLVKL